MEIRSSTVLPATRTDITLHTDDGLSLVGELAVPVDRPPVATLVFLHPLPTAGGYMDSHLIRKASNRLPALAGIATLRFNFRGVSSPRGQSEGSFGEGIDEAKDLAAALRFVQQAGLPRVWLVGWSFGTEVILKHAPAHWGEFDGAILMAPPLHRATAEDLAQWVGRTEPLVALVPEFDDFLTPEPARQRFAAIPHAEVVTMEGAKHLFVGEKYTRMAHEAILERVAPESLPLPTAWEDG